MGERLFRIGKDRPGFELDLLQIGPESFQFFTRQGSQQPVAARMSADLILHSE